MRISVPAGAFHKAALRKRGAQSDEAEGSRKKPRSRSPSAPQISSQPSTSPFPPHHLPVPSPPPRRSPTPLPPPRRSPVPVSPRSPAPTPPPEPAGPAASVQPEGSQGSGSLPAGDSYPPTAGLAPAEAPESSGRVPADTRQKAAVRHEACVVGSGPGGDKMGPIPSRPSLMNHPRIAEKLLSAASSPAIQEEMKRTNSRGLYRDGQTALLRVVNIFGHALSHVAGMERRIERHRREASESRDRATKAEDALKLAQAGEEERQEVIRSHARAAANVARQQIHNLTERAFMAEGKLMAADAELVDVKAQLEAARSDLKSLEEKVEIAEEVARLADLRAAEAMEAMKIADKNLAEAAEATRAANRKSAEAEAAALKAVESYRSSPVFLEEVADAGADAYLQGFYCGRDKAARVSGIEGLKELEPEEGDTAVDMVGKDPAPADDDAPLLASAPTTG